MIKALLLIFKPIPAWERIAVAQRKWVQVLTLFLLPMLVISCAVEGFGLVHWGKPRGRMAHITPLSIPQASLFEIAQLIVSLAVVWIGAKLIKSLGETFHGRHSFSQAFNVAAYGLSPLYLLRLLNVFPSVSPWVTWGIGIVLAAAILYHGLPRVMLPDPPHTFGLYLMSVVLLAMISGLACFLTTWYLEGRFTRLDTIISRFLPS
jgi:hypothetical protein